VVPPLRGGTTALAHAVVALWNDGRRLLSAVALG